MKRKFIRIFFEADASNGSGSDTSKAVDGGGGTPPVDGTNTEGKKPDTATPEKKESTPEERYKFQRDREKAEKAEKELKNFKDSQKPDFSNEDDPDEAEKNWEVDQRVKKQLKETLQEMGLDEKIKTLEDEKERKKFFEVVGKQFDDKFASLGLSKPDETQLAQILLDFDDKGISPQQLILLSKAEEIIARMSPGGFVPGTGAKAKVEVQKSQAEINNDIYRRHGVEW